MIVRMLQLKIYIYIKKYESVSSVYVYEGNKDQQMKKGDACMYQNTLLLLFPS